MGKILDGASYRSLDGKLCEIKQQMRQGSGYPFDPDRLDAHLQAAITGRFMGSMMHYLCDEPVLVRFGENDLCKVQLVQFGHELIHNGLIRPSTGIEEIEDQIRSSGQKLLNRAELTAFMEQCGQLARCFSVFGKDPKNAKEGAAPCILRVPRLGDGLVQLPLDHKFYFGSQSTFVVRF